MQNALEVGCTPDAADFEAKVEAALAVDPELYFPIASYPIRRTIQVPPNARIRGAGKLLTRFRRLGLWDGPTFRCGTPSRSAMAGSCEFTGFHVEQVHDGFVIGTSTTMADRQTTGQSHIEIWGGHDAKVDDIWFQHGQFGVSLYGTVHSTVSNIHSYGSWDNKRPEISEQIAVVRLAEVQSDPVWRYNTEITVSNTYIGCGGPSEDRQITVGNVTFTGYENVGAQYGVLVQGCEGLKIIDGYVGGCGGSNIAIQPFGLVSMITIDNMFLDECYDASIVVLPTGRAASVLNLGAGMRVNGQLKSKRALHVYDAGGTPSLYGLNITGGQYANFLENGFHLLGVKGAVINSPIVNNYNCRKSTLGDANVVVGAFVSGSSREVHFNGGLYGGGTNEFGTSNGAKFGVYFNNSAFGSAANIRAMLGQNGGAPVHMGGASPAQTYPV